MENAWNQSIGQFLEQAASSSPTPGGGSIAALVAALAASMTAMVGNLSTGEKYEQHQPLIQNVLGEIQQFDDICEQLLQEDITVFQQYMAAFKLPKSDEAAIAIRQQRIHEATLRAIEVPLALIKTCRNGLLQSEKIVAVGNKNVISDLGIALILFEAAAQSAQLTVEINVSSLKDQELAGQYRKRLTSLMDEIVQLKQSALLVVNNIIKK